jgi:Ca-activated chloride channel family protein
MTRFPVMATGLLLLCAPSGQAQVVPDRSPLVFAASVDTVLIDAFATRDGVAIQGLVTRDFALSDNGAPQAFDLVPADSLPIRAILVFDASSSVEGTKLARLRTAAESFLDQLRPQDEAALISFSEEVAWLSPLTLDRARVKGALRLIRAQGATAVYDALFAALVMPRSALRTLVILFSDGEDNMSFLDEARTRRMVERSNALIHVVAAKSRGPAPGLAPSEANHIKSLAGLARITGGSLIEVESPERIGAAFSEIILGMKSRYVLRYAPETEPVPGWHKLDVRLTSGQGKVRGRAGYWVEAR